MGLKTILRKIYYRNRTVREIGYKSAIMFFLIQRVVRINSHVPWPVHWSSMVIYPGRIKAHDTSRRFIGYMPGCYIQAVNGIEVGKNVWIGPGVKIISANHDVSDYTAHPMAGPVRIGDDCWLGANCVVLPEVVLGDHVVVGAGAVVTKSFIEGNCIVAGVPAQVVKKIGEYRPKDKAV